MTITVTGSWARAMERAMKAQLKATRRADGTYRVPSKSKPGTSHTVLLDDAGKIIHCDCKGWDRYGRSNPCQHAGSVAIGVAYLMGASIVPQRDEPASIESPRRGRTQIYRAAVR